MVPWQDIASHALIRTIACWLGMKRAMVIVCWTGKPVTPRGKGRGRGNTRPHRKTRQGSGTGRVSRVPSEHHKAHPISLSLCTQTSLCRHHPHIPSPGGMTPAHRLERAQTTDNDKGDVPIAYNTTGVVCHPGYGKLPFQPLIRCRAAAPTSAIARLRKQSRKLIIQPPSALAPLVGVHLLLLAAFLSR